MASELPAFPSENQIRLLKGSGENRVSQGEDLKRHFLLRGPSNLLPLHRYEVPNTVFLGDHVDKVATAAEP